MNELIEAFRKHWTIQVLGMCAVVAAATWALAMLFVERPLKDQVERADRQAATLRDQLAGMRDQLAGLRDQVSFLTRLQPPAAASPSSAATAQGGEPKQDPGFASGACSILDEGNKLYAQGKYTEAANKYLTVQSVDKLGRSACVGSIYATIGTIYALLAEPHLANSNPGEAARNYRLANEYNRAFAAAAICNRGDCKLSENYWSKSPITPR